MTAENGDSDVVDHTFDDETQPSFAIIRAICVLENVDPVDAPQQIDFTLYGHIDPQAQQAFRGQHR
ncbi:hypothetical protein G6M89_18930 [Natronolimnobius sp. AArcel1]|nr:hypothetical protein [Natronolimnobius sp. AArcel1]